MTVKPSLAGVPLTGDEDGDTGGGGGPPAGQGGPCRHSPLGRPSPQTERPTRAE